MPLSLRARCVPGLWPAYRRCETARDCLRLASGGQAKSVRRDAPSCTHVAQFFHRYQNRSKGAGFGSEAAFLLVRIALNATSAGSDGQGAKKFKKRPVEKALARPCQCSLGVNSFLGFGNS